MKKILIYLSLSVVSVFFTMCDKETYNNDTSEFSLLNGNNFILKIDRVLNHPDVQFPNDNLQESDYDDTSDDIYYDISFSENGQTVTIEPGSVRAKYINGSKESLIYELDEGVFSGGRFVIWINNNDFRVEYTIYGSGVPIVKSERGNLEKVIK